MNSACNRIADQLASTINGEAWYGDSLHKILANVTATQASAHPVPDLHSIWQLVHHMNAWVNFALRAMQGVPIPAWSSMPEHVDWPPVSDMSDEAWKRATESFFSSYLLLQEAITKFDDDRLDAIVPGRNYDFYRLFHSMIQHAVYHSAQIALLKKAI